MKLTLLQNRGVQAMRKKVLKAFCRNEDGSILALTLLLFIVMLVMGGMAVDFMRFEIRRTELQSITDRSVLAAAAIRRDTDPQQVIDEYFTKAGFDPSIVTATILADSSSEREIRAEATSDINTFYLHYVGIDTLAAPALSVAQEGVNNVEVSLVLDYSLSMTAGGSTGELTEFGPQRAKIGDLQDAARAFATDLLRPEFDGRFSLNIIPYGGHVNPGREMAELLAGTDLIDREPIYFGDEGFDLAVDGPFLPENTVYWADDTDDVFEGFPGFHVYVGEDGVAGFNPLTGDNDDVRLVDVATFGTATDVAGADDILGNADDLPVLVTDELPVDDIFGPDGIYGTSDDDQFSGAIKFADLDGVLFNDGQTPADLDPAFLAEIQAAGAITLDQELVHLNESGDGLDIQFAYEPPYNCMEILDSDFDNSFLPTFTELVPTFSRYPGQGAPEWRHERGAVGWGWCPGDSMQIQYGLQDPTEVDDFMSEIRTYHGTGTNMGMKWGLALLDPAARPRFTALNAMNREADGKQIVPDASLGRPADFDDTGTTKIIILMTDGGITNQIRPVEPDQLRILRDEINNGAERTTVTTRNNTRSQLISQCDIAKDDYGIQVFTIAFEVNAADEQDMIDCATPVDQGPANQYYYPASGAGLTDAFQDIAQQITALRLTQ